MVYVEGQRLRLVCCCITATYGTDDDHRAALLHGVAYLGKADALLLHELAELQLVLVAHLDDHAGVLGEEGLDDVAIGAQVVQVDVHSALRVGEAHL